MTDDHRRHRDAATGEFVSEDFAAQHPATTTSESTEPRYEPPAMPDAEQQRLAHNLAAMLTEQLGVPLRAVVTVEEPDDEHSETWLSVGIALAVETANTIHQQGRKLVAR